LKESLNVEIELKDFPCGECRMLDRNELFEGVSAADLIWRRLPGVPYAKTPDSPGGIGRTALSVKPPLAAQALTYPAYLVKTRYGKGELVLDATRWDDVPRGRAGRFAAALFANLGARQRTDVGLANDPMAPLPAEGLTFQTFDISKYANAGFIDDEEANNGKGGWFDGGGFGGLEGFPTGLQKFLGIPFDIADPARNDGKGLVQQTAEAGNPCQFLHRQAFFPSGSRLGDRQGPLATPGHLPGLYGGPQELDPRPSRSLL
jgi:hypothetical protein